MFGLYEGEVPPVQGAEIEVVAGNEGRALVIAREFDVGGGIGPHRELLARREIESSQSRLKDIRSTVEMLRQGMEEDKKAIEEEQGKSVELANDYPNVWASVGLHPHDAEAVSNLSTVLEELRSLAQNDKVVAIGEIGLDYFDPETGTEVANNIKKEQLALFEAQLSLAKEQDLPPVPFAFTFREHGSPCYLPAAFRPAGFYCLTGSSVGRTIIYAGMSRQPGPILSESHGPGRGRDHCWQVPSSCSWEWGFFSTHGSSPCFCR